MNTIGFLQTNQSLNHKSKKAPWNSKPSKNSTIFGKNIFLPINMKKQMNDNTLVIGTSGTGKTYSFVEPNILQGNANYIIADAKGDILKDLGNSLVQMGYKIQVINLVDLRHSMTYNPLHYMSNQLEIMHFADMIVSSDVTGKMSTKKASQDPFWTNAAGNVLQALILFVKEFLPQDQQTIGNVVNLFDILNMSPANISDALELLKESKLNYEYQLKSADDNDTIGNHIFAWAEEQKQDSQAVKAWRKIADTQGAARTWSSIMSILGAALSRYALHDVVNIMSSNQLKFSELLKSKTALFILYDDADSSKNYISNTLYTQLFGFLYKAARRFGNKLPIKVRLFLDDFKNISIPNFDDYIATSRSRNISICMMLQNESQLVAKFGENAQSVIGNCSAYLLTGTTDLHMAKIAADRFGISANEIRLKDDDHFLLDLSGHIANPIRYDFHKHPAYVDKAYNINKHFVTPVFQNRENTELLNIVKSMPGVLSPFDLFNDDDTLSKEND